MNLGAPEIIIIAIVIFALFGYKKLPDATRAIGRSLRIFKGEMKGFKEDDVATKAEAQTVRSPLPPAPPSYTEQQVYAPQPPAQPAYAPQPPAQPVYAPQPAYTEAQPAPQAYAPAAPPQAAPAPTTPVAQPAPYVAPAQQPAATGDQAATVDPQTQPRG